MIDVIMVILNGTSSKRTNECPPKNKTKNIMNQVMPNKAITILLYPEYIFENLFRPQIPLKSGVSLNLFQLRYH